MVIRKPAVILINICLIVIFSSLNAASESEQKSCGGIVWGVSARQGHRSSMEDTHAARRFVGSPDKAFFGIYDGHGGSKSADIIAGKTALKPLHTLFAESTEPSAQQKLRDAYSKMEDTLLNHSDTSGSTAVTVYVDKTTKKLFIAWAGDSRALIVKGDTIYCTTDHKPTDTKEKARIDRAYGLIKNKCLFDGFGYYLAVSRALGDKALKTGHFPMKGLSAVPEVAELDFKEEENILLILACDGIWDVISNEDAARFVVNNLNSSISKINPDTVRERSHEGGNHYNAISAARTLRDIAFAKGSKDNISVLVAVINKTCESFTTTFSAINQLEPITFIEDDLPATQEVSTEEDCSDL